MIIVLSGPDTYRSQRRLIQLREAYRTKHDPSGLSLVALDGTTVTIEELHNAVQAAGFFSSKRFVSLNTYRAADSAVQPDDLQALAKKIAKDPEIILVLREVPKLKTDGSPAADRNAKKLTLSGAKAEIFPLLSEAEVRKWIQAEVQRRKGAIMPAAVAQLATWCGSDLWRLDNELEKLLLFVGQNPIDLEAINAQVLPPDESDVFALTDALGAQQTARALQLLERELTAGANPLGLISLLANHVRRLVMIQRALGSGQSPTAMAASLAIHPFVIKKGLGQAKHFTLARLQAWHHQLVSIDRTLKSTPLDAASLLNVMMLRI